MDKITFIREFIFTRGAEKFSAQVQVTIDVDGLARSVGGRAAAGKAGKATKVGGMVSARRVSNVIKVGG